MAGVRPKKVSYNAAMERDGSSAPGVPPTAAMLVIGNEILSGRTQDKNIAHVAGRMSDIGIRLQEVRVVPDVRERIVASVRELSDAYDHVITTGGIGPTHDDITTECVAEAMGAEVERNPEALRRLQRHYEGTKIEINEARLKMANIPKGADLIDNPVSAAPGFRLGNVHVLAGVPEIMQAMFSVLEPDFAGGPPMLSRTFVVSRPEGALAAGLGEVAKVYADVDIGSYPYYRPPSIGTSVVARTHNEERLMACAEAISAFLKATGASFREENSEKV